MAKKCKKQCPTSLATREMQFKAKIRCYFTPTRMALIKKMDSDKDGEN